MSENNDEPLGIRDAITEGQLLSFLEEVDFREIEAVAATVLLLAKNGDLDFGSEFSGIKIVQLAPEALRKVERVLVKVLPEIDCSPPEALDICHALIDARGQRGSEQVAISTFEKWLASRSACSAEILDALEKSERDSPLLLAALIARAEVEAAGAVERSRALARDGRPTMRRLAIMALGIMSLSGSHLQSANDFLVSLSASAEREVDRATAISAIHRRLETIPNPADKPERLFAALEAACDNPSPEIVGELIHGLLLENIGHPTSLKDSIFALMPRVAADDARTINIIDLVLYGLDLDAERDRALGAIKGMLKDDKQPIAIDALDSTKHKLAAEPPDVLGWYIGELLLDGHRNLGDAASQIFPPLDTKIYHFDLSSHGLSENELCYLVRKVFAYLMLVRGPAVSLLAACLKLLSGDALKAVEYEIASFWLVNYPGDIALFESLLDKSPELSSSVRRLKKARDAYLRGLSESRSNDAFKPSPPERHVQWDIKRKEQLEISKQAHKASAFLAFVHTKTMLYGRGAVSYVYGPEGDKPTRQETLYHSFETSMPIPRMEILCPERLAYLRLRYRMEEKPR